MATITVGTNSYVTESELTTYATDRGITIAAVDKTVLLIKAMDFIETRIYVGNKTVYNQPLQFPRTLCSSANAYDSYDGFSPYPQNYYYQPCEYDNLTVPSEIKKAQMIASLLIDTGYDLQSTLGQSIKREKVGPLETEYQDNTSGYEQHRALNDILRPFIANSMIAVRV